MDGAKDNNFYSPYCWNNGASIHITTVEGKVGSNLSVDVTIVYLEKK